VSYRDDVVALSRPLTDARDLDALVDRMGDARVVMRGSRLRPMESTADQVRTLRVRVAVDAPTMHAVHLSAVAQLVQQWRAVGKRLAQ
jgi:hypothetical protein